VEPALDDLARAERASPEHPGVFLTRARACTMLGRRDDAIAALTRAKELAPNSPEAEALVKALPADEREEHFGGAE
jgi:Flp pilus assembly protein TadD